MVNDVHMLDAEQALDVLRSEWKSKGKAKIRTMYNRFRREGRCTAAFTFSSYLAKGWSYRPASDDVIVNLRGASVN